MSTLPTTRKKVPEQPPARSPAEPNDRLEQAWSLEAAFESFTEAAGSLETFYSTLSAEVRHLRSRLDETNRELSESLEANRRMRLHLERVLDSLPCGVIVLDPTGLPGLVNPEVHRVLAEVDPAGDTAFSRLLGQLSALGAGGTATEQELRLEGSAGVRVVGARSRALPSKGATSDETIWILRDLTDEKRLEAEMEAARRVQALADMAGLLAHEIRNPLGSLELFASLIADHIPADTEPRAWADQLQAGLRTLGATVNNVLQFHGASRGVQVPQDVVGLLTETIEFLRPMARQWNAEIRLCSSFREATISAEPQGLRQVFLNLAMNAFSAMPSGGVLEIVVERFIKGSEEWVRIEFADGGRGIAPEDLEDIFNPGFSTKPNSSGLGLFVSRDIVRTGGGQISATSVLDEGTTFTLSFRLIGVSE